MKIYKTVYSFFIFCILGFLTSCDINDSYVNCETGTPMTVYFRYFADTNDMTNVISNYINDGVLYIYDSETNSLVDTVKVSKQEFLNGKTLVLQDKEYRFVCWGNKDSKSMTTDEKNFTLSKISCPEYTKGEKIVSNDRLYYASRMNLKNDSKLFGVQRTDTLTFVSSHINFLIRVHGIRDNKDIRSEVTNLMPEYDFEMRNAKAFDTSYFPVVTSTKTDDSKNILYRDFEFSVLRFKEDNNIQIKLFDSDTNEQLAPAVKLSDYIKMNKINVNQQELTIFIEYRFTDAGVKVTIKEWVNEDVIPGT